MARRQTRRAHGYTTFKRSDGRWGWAVTIGVDSRTGNPKRRQGTCATEKEARDRAHEVLQQHRQGTLPSSAKSPRFDTVVDEWLQVAVLPNLAPKTAKYYADMVRLHLKPDLGALAIDRISSPVIQKLLNGKFSAGLSPHTVRGIFAVLRTALNYAQEVNHLTLRPNLRVKLPRHAPKDVQYLSLAQVRRLLAAAEGDPMEHLITVALSTGMRIGEVTGLTWSDVDSEARVIRVRQQLQRVDGLLVLRPLKSRSSKRVLHISDLAYRAFTKQRAHTEGLEDVNSTGLVFVTGVGTPLDPRNVNRTLYRLLEKAGLPRVSSHALRHTAATLSVSSGVPLAVVRDQLGHSSIALTAGAYSHAVPEAMKQGANRLAEAIEGKIEGK
ncbi:MAG: site-specific integrase [Fimbriimonadaceae bacterium]|nr:site-specific integrase [Fimbriimonadaceae bacterium]